MMQKETSLSEEAVSVIARPGYTLLEALEEQGICVQGGCNKTGRCGRCRVRFPLAAPAPAPGDRRMLSPEELRSGVRLACLHRADREYRVIPQFRNGPEIAIVDCGPDQDAPNKKEPGDTPPGPGSLNLCGGWMAAVDLGTTTLVIQACDCASGKELKTLRFMNPQRKYGGDVVSRMQAAESGKPGALKRCVQELIGGACDRLTKEYETPPQGVFIAGNTVMEHLFAGLPTKGLGRYPFRPVTLREQQLCLPGGQPVTLLPGLSAFVGADVLAGVLSCRMAEREEITLLIDLGTNGEMVLGNKEKLLCTAAAAGPAFEGGPQGGITGTDMIAAAAGLLERGVLDETGLMAEPYFQTGIRMDRKSASPAALQDNDCENRTFLLRQEDIRAIQMAKAAVYAGICVLVKEYGITLADISQVYLAGGFGYFLDVKKAAQIGLFPARLAGRVKAAGNTSLAGAKLYGRSAALQTGDEAGMRMAAERIRQLCIPLNLADHPDFEPLYLEHLNLGAS